MAQAYGESTPEAGLPRNWLAVRLGAMGDVLLTTGVLDYWHRRRGLRFSVLTKASWAELLANHPAVGDIVGLDAPQLRLAGFLRTARGLARACKGWGLLDLHGTPRSRLLSLLWQGPVRRYPKMALERRLYGLWRSPGLRCRLEAVNVPQRYALALESHAPGAQELAPRIFLGEQEREAARRLLAPLRAAGRPLVALHPLAAHANKAWPAQRWQELAQGLRSAGWGCYFLGSGQLPPSLPQDAADANFINAASPRESAALLAESQALVTADSGPMHLGVAAGTPTVALFGPTAKAWGFYPPAPHRVLEEELDCRPCSLHGKRPCPRGGECLERISAGRVLAALQQLCHGGKAGHRDGVQQPT